MTGDTPLKAPSLEAILGALPEAVVVFDVRGRIVYANERFGALHGYDPKELASHGIRLNGIAEPVEQFLSHCRVQ